MSQALSKAPLNVLRTRGMAILDQLRLEEALLRNTKSNWLVINDGAATPAVVLGISGDPHKLVHVESARQAGVPLIKRFTGGGTVIVDKNTIFVTMIMNQADLQHVEPFPRPIMEFTHEVCFLLLASRISQTTLLPTTTIRYYVCNRFCGNVQVYSDVFHTLSVDKSRVPDSTKRKHKLGGKKNDMPFKLTNNDYTMGDRKIGGNAQAILKNRWLHHTSFLWDFNDTRMALLKEPERRPVYRGDRKHQSFMTALSAFGFCRQEFADVIEDAFVCQGFEVDHSAGNHQPLPLNATTKQAQFFLMRWLSIPAGLQVRRMLISF